VSVVEQAKAGRTDMTSATQQSEAAEEALPTRAPDYATREDLHHAYRLLLGREPDASGWSHLCRALSEQRIPPADLAMRFMESAEFAARHSGKAHHGPAEEVVLDGFSLFVRADDRDIGRHIRATHLYETHVTAAIRNLLVPGNVFVDVGANIGYFTNLAAHLVGPAGRVVAVEALDKNAQLIFRALERNGFDHVRVSVCAASDRNGRVSIRSDSGTSNGQAVAAGAGDFFVQTRLLDDLTADLPRIDLVKLDIEGFELLAWRGFRRMLTKHRPNVLTEFHPYCMRKFVGLDPGEYLDELFAYSSEVYVLNVDGKMLRCGSPEDVMSRWVSENDVANADGKRHLDLFASAKQ
jgi:FkbM family methyltransferase